MARNEEKAQSMLYRFREAQAAELGLGTRGDKRPRMASACNSLRDCERWRGEILREISRKVSKIQDAGMTDYEVRDLNDEINKLLREKRHWENQIVSLGGANYRRNMAMLDDDGREVPGTKGYKYFGRAKELPGVKELFQSKKKEEEEENATFSHYKRFMNQGEDYYGAWQEGEEELEKAEREEEENEWEEACANARGALGLPADSPVPPFPLSKPPLTATIAEAVTETVTKGKSKSKSKAKSSKSKPPDTSSDQNQPMEVDSDPQRAAANLLVSHAPFFSPEELMQPKLPTRSEMEGVLLELRKRAVLDEYFGDEEMAKA